MKHIFKKFTALMIAAVMLISCASMMTFASEDTSDVLLYKESFASEGDWTSINTLGSGSGFQVANSALTITAAAGGQNGRTVAMPAEGWGDCIIDTDVTISGGNDYDTFSILYKYIFQYRVGSISWIRKTNEFYFNRDVVQGFTHRGTNLDAAWIGHHTAKSDYRPYWDENGDIVKVSAEGVFNPDGKNNIKLETRDGKLKFYVNGTLLLDYVETTPIDNGGIGFGAYTQGDNPFTLSVTSLSVTGEEYDYKSLHGNITGGTLVLAERFNEGTAAWTAIDGHNNGSYEQTDSDYSKTMSVTAPENKDMWVVADGKQIVNTTMTVYAKSEGSGYQAILRYESVNKYYYFDITEENGGTVKLYKRLNDETLLLAEQTNIEELANIDLTDWNILRFRADGNTLSMYGGTQMGVILSYTDDNTGVLNGYCGVGVSGGTAMFDDIEIYSDAQISAGVMLYPIEPVDELDMNHNDKEENVYKDIYVSVNGTSSGNGTKENPYNTVQKAVDSLAGINEADVTGNIVIHIEGGRYELDAPLTFNENTSGKNGYYVILKGEEGENGRANLSAGKEVKGTWQQSEIDGVYKIPVEAPVEGFKELYINGNRKYRAGEVHYNPQFENFTYNENGGRSGMIVPKSILPEVARPDEIELQFGTSWRSYHPQVKSITHHDEYNNFVTFKGWDLRLAACDFYGVSLGTRLIYYMVVEGAKEFLNTPGEFYYDKTEKMLYYYPEEGEDLSTASCVIPALDRAMIMEGSGVDNRVENVKITGIDFSDTGWEYMTKHGYMNEQYPLLYGSDPEGEYGQEHILAQGGVHLDFVENIKFEDNTFRNFGGAGIYILNAADNIQIVGNVIDDIAESGIAIGSYGIGNMSRHMKYNHLWPYQDYASPVSNVLIKNNVIRNASRVYHSSCCIVSTYTRNLYILNNDIQGGGASTVALGMGWTPSTNGNLAKTCVMYNSIKDYNNQRDLNDTGGIYTLSSTMGSIIAENYIDNDSGGCNAPIYLDNSSSYYTVVNNVQTNTNKNVFANINAHSNLFARNYTANNAKPTNQGFDTSIITETYEINKYDEAIWPQKAVEVKANAGLEEGYEYLYDRITTESERATNLSRLECYESGNSEALKRGRVTEMIKGDSTAKAKVSGGELYLPIAEMEQVAYLDRHTYGTGLSCSYNPSEKKVVIALLTKSSEDPKLLTTTVGSGYWELNGNEYTDLPTVEFDENGNALIPAGTVLKLLELDRAVVCSGDVAVICDAGYSIDLAERTDIVNTIADKIKK